jgi:hypothetical protein
VTDNSQAARDRWCHPWPASVLAALCPRRRMLFAGRDQLSGLGAGMAETSRHHHFGRFDVDTRRRADGSVEDFLRASASIYG